jgi:putative flippase GtrA
MRETVIELVRYGLKGGSTMLGNLVLMALLVERGGLPPEVAAVLSTGTMICVGYLLMQYWVFPGGDVDSHRKRGVAYVLTILGGKAVNYVLFVGLLAVLPYPLAWVGGAGIVFLGLFSANRALFKHEVVG